MNDKRVQALPWKQLARATAQTLPLPFQLTLDDTAQPLVCHQILRLLPGKRLVAAAVWGEQDVVVKLFYGRDAKRHLKREVSGIEILRRANVPSPILLYQGCAYKKRVYVIVTERIQEAVSLDSIWQSRESYLEVPALMRSFTIELATQHVLGILQRDLHLSNFLITDKRIYTLDGSTITQYENILDKKTSLENLGLFFAQLGVGMESLQQELFEVYVKARGWLVKKADINLLRSAIKTATHERWRRYRRKIFRPCTAFNTFRHWFQRGVYDRAYSSPTLLHWLQFPETFFTDPAAILLKKGRSSTVAKISMDQRVLVVKRYNIKNSFHWLRRCLRETRAKTAWRLAQHLHLFGVPTAKPIAYVEKHFFGLSGTSYLLMEYLPGPTSGEFFSVNGLETSQCETVAKRILALFNALSELQMTHGDLKSTNIIIHGDQPYLIDLDGMQEHTLAVRFQKAYKKALQRFMRNWNTQPNVFALFTGLLKKAG